MKDVAEYIAALAAVVLLFWGILTAASWYLSEEDRQVSEGVKDARTTILPITDDH